MLAMAAAADSANKVVNTLNYTKPNTAVRRCDELPRTAELGSPSRNRTPHRVTLDRTRARARGLTRNLRLATSQTLSTQDSPARACVIVLNSTPGVERPEPDGISNRSPTPTRCPPRARWAVRSHPSTRPLLLPSRRRPAAISYFPIVATSAPRHPRADSRLHARGTRRFPLVWRRRGSLLTPRAALTPPAAPRRPAPPRRLPRTFRPACRS